MTREPFIAHSELTNEIYIVVGKEKYRVTEQAIKAVMATKALEQEPNKSEIPTGSTIKDDLALIHTWGLDEEIRCIMCTNHMKSDRGCDGSCVVNKNMYNAVMDAIEKRIQSTTKNDLTNDVPDINVGSIEPILDKIRAEIEKQEKWLLQAGYNAYNVDIAFWSIKSVLTESEDKNGNNNL